MKRHYTLFVTDDELLASPYIRRFNFLHDLTLHLGQAEEVNFLLQEPLSAEQRDALRVRFDEATLEVSNVKVIPFKYQTLITAIIVPKELGSVRIGFEYPHASTHYERKPILGIRQPAPSVIGSPFDFLRSRRQ